MAIASLPSGYRDALELISLIDSQDLLILSGMGNEAQAGVRILQSNNTEGRLSALH